MIEHSRGERLIDLLITIARSEYPSEWSRFCELAQDLTLEANRQAIGLSAEDYGRRLLAHCDRAILGQGLIGDFYGQLVGAAPSQLQLTTWEATRLEQIFRERLTSALQSGTYSLTGFRPDLSPISIPSELINPKLLRFDRDEIKINDTKITSVRAVPTSRQIVIPQAPGPKPGHETAKRRVDDAVRTILESDAERPPKGRGRMVSLARIVQERLASEGLRYRLNSIEKMIRPAVKEWEKRNPDK